MLLLHELGHLMKVFSSDLDQEIYDAYTNRVLKECFGKQLQR